MHRDSIRLLLSSDDVSRAFGKIPALCGRRVYSAAPVTSWVKPGRHFNACFRVSLDSADGAAMLVSAFVLDADRAAHVVAKAGPHRPGSEPADCAHCSVALAAPDLLLQLFPHDYRLPTLALCLDAGRVSRAVGAGIEFIGCEPCGYRPGMRCQIRYWTADGRAVYGKVAVEKAAGQAHASYQYIDAASLRAGAGFRVPTVVEHIADLQLTLVNAVNGESLYDKIRRQQVRAAQCEAAALALWDFHRLVVDSVERVYGVADELQLIHGWTTLVADIYPQLAMSLHACEQALRSARPEAVPARALVHRDFYDKQILLGDSGIALLDLDTACRGDPEIDLANFGAHLRLRGLQWGQRETCEWIEECFLRAYPGRVATDRVVWYRRAALLRLACVYAFRPHWHHLAPQLIAEAMHP
jgi:hypothetical protein